MLQSFEEADKNGRPYAITARLPYKMREDGLPMQGELSKVYDLEEAIQKALEPKGALFLGHVTYNGSMLVMFYGRESAPATVSVKVGLFKRVEIPLESRHDPNWDVFALEMKPTELEAEQMRNYQLLGVLREKGDDPNKAREVDFSARFPSSESRSQFLKAIEENGFFVRDDKALWEPEPGDFWCEFVLATSIEDEVIARHGLYLRELASSLGGEFDGWACHVTP